jgi:hypothetical protein
MTATIRTIELPNDRSRIASRGFCCSTGLSTARALLDLVYRSVMRERMRSNGICYAV